MGNCCGAPKNERRLKSNLASGYLHKKIGFHDDAKLTVFIDEVQEDNVKNISKFNDFDT